MNQRRNLSLSTVRLSDQTCEERKKRGREKWQPRLSPWLHFFFFDFLYSGTCGDLMFVDFPFSFTRDGWQILGPVWEMTKVKKIFFFLSWLCIWWIKKLYYNNKKNYLKTNPYKYFLSFQIFIIGFQRKNYFYKKVMKIF